ncbi:general secretion pathway protein GspB [Gallaecimonas pentaromativorans]|uniref:General secretion pathway protein B n=1 Tax=Gallaecimonas pentaromativorans TaxID=584787 RepID=A0A3N1NXH6_9GAMM|nr:general secretion pathway protein GspB [Gallaecimonas pentaromativorans]ROQ19140.1 general secretion pathway protein B [Gallaecimonas pentaromativorans]
MSYILEVLKQSERQRRQGQQAPGLDTPQAMPPPPKPKGASLLPYLLVLAALLAAWLFWPSAPAPVKMPTAKVKSAAPGLDPKALSPVTLETEQPILQTPAAPVENRADSKPPSSELAQATLPPPIAEPVAVPAKEPATKTDSEAPAPEAEQTAQTEAADTEQALPSWRQLPVDVQRQLPALVVTVHIYAKEPKDRLVKINNRAYGEGAKLGNGLTLTAITPDGIELEYRQWRFTMPAY